MPYYGHVLSFSLYLSNMCLCVVCDPSIEEIIVHGLCRRPCIVVTFGISADVCVCEFMFVQRCRFVEQGRCDSTKLRYTAIIIHSSDKRAASV